MVFHHQKTERSAKMSLRVFLETMTPNFKAQAPSLSNLLLSPLLYLVYGLRLNSRATVATFVYDCGFQAR